MKSKFKWGGMLILAILFLFVPILVQGNVLINEVFPNPKGSDKGKEFVELYNDGRQDVSLAEWLIKRTSKKDVIKKYKFKDKDIVKKGEYFVLQTDSLNNDGALIELFNNQGQKIDKKEYGKSREGQSYNRNETKESTGWYWAEPTSKKKNRENPADKKYPKIQLNEIYPNPADAEKVDEFIELYNPNNKDIDLQNWQLRDASKTGKLIFKKQTIIKAKSYLTIFRQQFKFALNNSGEEKVILLTPNNQTSDDLKYQGSTKGLSYSYNQNNKKWVWTQFLTSGKENKFNHKPTFKIQLPEKIFSGEKKEFKLQDLQDVDDDELEIVWDFGDGHKLKGDNVRYKYKKTGQYIVNVTVDDGIENVIKKAKIKVSTLPLAKLIFIRLLPNPAGADTGKEEISIKNIGQNKVNLKDYKITTGSTRNKIVKHIILQDTIIKPGEVVTITNNKVCKFTLTNKQGVVQLLMPDDRIIDKVEYSKDNILPDQEYILDKNNQWYWNKINLFPGNHLPTFKIKQPKKVYKNIYAEFKVKHLKDKDGDKLKVIWDFGDGHKSYLKKAKHKYKKTGKYKVTLIVKDSKEKVSKTFNIKVKKYPKYKLQIVGLMPNPDGKDRGKEFILLKNNSKKKLNLFQYKVVTGQKRLTRHPLYKKFIIKPGEIKKLFNQTISKFNLLNSGGIVQLLYPNDKVASEVKYSKNKILPNEQYLLSANKNWQWKGGVLNNSSGNNDFGIQVLGSNKTNKKYLDITLNTKTKMCETIRQIKIANWQAENNQNKLKKYFLYFKFNKYSKSI